MSTKHGNINTEHILFICSGAFHSSKPSDMLAELQGRLPIRVELAALTQEDFYRILTEPQHNMIQQHQVRGGLGGGHGRDVNGGRFNRADQVYDMWVLQQKMTLF